MVKIKCPNCGSEYLISEIFYSDDLLDNPEVIIRDEENKILDIIGEKATYKEEYTCDFCNTPFEVLLEIKPKVVASKK